MAWLRRFNIWVALHGVAVFGSIWTAYLFFFYGFLPLFFPQQQITLLYWSNTVQLWSLPLIMVGTNLLNRKYDDQTQRQYTMIERIDLITQTMMDTLATQRAMLTSLIDVAEASTSLLQKVEAKTQEIDAEVDALTEKEGNPSSTTPP